MRISFLMAVLILFAPTLQAEPLRIVHVMSYHIGWTWNQEQFHAFRQELADLAVEYQVLELDAKRSDEASVLKQAQKATQLIREWHPHLVYINDDVAQELVTRRFLNHSIPFVYSAVNKRPEDYGFHLARNVVGVLEEEHVLPSLNLLRAIQPRVRKIAVVTDADPAWTGTISRMRRELKGLPEVEVVDWARPDSFSDYQKKIREYQSSADAIVFLGIFTFSGKHKKPVHFEQVQRWTAENSRLPDVSFWESRVENGTLSAVGISALEQGREAGKLARKILVDGASPADLQSVASTKGQPFISLARARDLGLPIPASLLLSSKVKTEYAWSK